MHFHKWSKWEMCQLTEIDGIFGRSEKRDAQKRTCLKCNLIRVRYLTG